MQIKVLSENQIEEIKKKTEYILENIGFRVNHKEILKKAAKAGAKIDDSTETIKIPSGMLRELLSKVPDSFTIKGINNKEYRLGRGEQHSLAIVTDPWIIDYKTQSPRRPCLEDVRRHTIVAQKLDHVAGISRMDFPVTDCSDASSSFRALETHLLNHTKHNFVYLTSMENYYRWVDIGNILAQGEDLSKSKLITMAIAIVSPLTLADINAELLLEATSNNFAVIPTICPMAGTTSPYSKDSTLLLGNAENIFLAALTQLINPGNPFIYAFGPSRSNMRTGHDMYFTMDKMLWKIAAAELALSYSMPVMSECGGSMTYRYDQQNGAEGILFMLGAQNSKSNLLSGIGSCHNANGMSAEMMVIQTAWLDAVKFLNRGISTSTLEKGIESIKNAGFGGNFLTDDLTIELLRSDEFFNNNIFDYSGGFEEGSSILENAHNEVEKMVTGYESPVPGKVKEGLMKYFHDLYKDI
ncbi:MAG: hypothetical protein FIA99_10040 [Ruminiclostridium sp.]|nr:hypothetical protein [Ruminiclostridium sp.]